MSTHPRGAALRAALNGAVDETGLTLDELTVGQRDQFRLDTPANHRDGAWFAERVTELGLGEKTIHLRGIHYALLGKAKPNGTAYINTDKEWEWLSATAAKAARWLGYVDFEQIHDGRNDAPEVVELAEQTQPIVDVVAGLGQYLYIPELWEVLPHAELTGFTAAQPYRLVMVGEKSSLHPVLSPIARAFGADLYLFTGDASDTLTYRIVADAAADGRPLRVFYFADADPAGWNMPVIVGRKMQAAAMSRFPDLDFQMHLWGSRTRSWCLNSGFRPRVRTR